MKIRQNPSPNADERGVDTPIDMLVLHYTGMETGQAALDRLCDPQAKVSAHYVVEEDGRVFQLVPEEMRAWHAGVASWRGHQNINARSIGIEIVNPGHEFGYRDFPIAQMEAVIALSHDILSRHAIPARHVVGHSDVAFRRKQDPGELFDWKLLAEHTIGLWPIHIKAGAEMQWLQEGDVGQAVSQLQEQLRIYGYDVLVDGLFGPVLKQAVIAFQRHFRQDKLNGVWDGECQAALDALHGCI